MQQGSTSGDSELIDVRVGYDGITSASAGESVRRQAGNLIETFKNISSVNNVQDIIKQKILFPIVNETVAINDALTAVYKPFSSVILNGTLANGLSRYLNKYTVTLQQGQKYTFIVMTNDTTDSIKFFLYSNTLGASLTENNVEVSVLDGNNCVTFTPDQTSSYYIGMYHTENDLSFTDKLISFYLVTDEYGYDEVTSSFKKLSNIVNNLQLLSSIKDTIRINNIFPSSMYQRAHTSNGITGYADKNLSSIKLSGTLGSKIQSYQSINNIRLESGKTYTFCIKTDGNINNYLRFFLYSDNLKSSLKENSKEININGGDTCVTFTPDTSGLYHLRLYNMNTTSSITLNELVFYIYIVEGEYEYSDFGLNVSEQNDRLTNLETISDNSSEVSITPKNIKDNNIFPNSIRTGFTSSGITITANKLISRINLSGSIESNTSAYYYIIGK